MNFIKPLKMSVRAILIKDLAVCSFFSLNEDYISTRERFGSLPGSDLTTCLVRSQKILEFL